MSHEPTIAVQDVQIRRWTDGQVVEVADRVAVEAPLEIRLDGAGVTVLMRTPGHDEEMVAGFLITEGIVQDRGDVVAMMRPEGLTGDERGNVIDVHLKPGRGRRPPERLFYASSSCGVCGKSSIAQLGVISPRVDHRVAVRHDVLRYLPAALRSNQPTFDATGGLHGAALTDTEGVVMAAREDIGRHNAVDKLVGWAQGAGDPLPSRVLVVSGRVGFEIVQKAIAVGIPIVAAVGAPSSAAIDLAERFGVTLVGFIRGDAMNVYTSPERVL